MTKIWHPNVDYDKGEPCVDFLTESWKPEMTLRHVLQTIRGLMALPNTGMCAPSFSLVLRALSTGAWQR